MHSGECRLEVKLLAAHLYLLPMHEYFSLQLTLCRNDIKMVEKNFILAAIETSNLTHYTF